jgi:hypothetical protein
MSLRIDSPVRLALAAALSLLILSESALAAGPSLGYPKGRPYYGSSNQRASRSIRHSRDYSRDIYRYSRDANQMDPTVAKAESEELGRNISKAQKDIAAARKDAGTDQKTLTALKSIDEHLATAAAQHAKLHEECCKDEVDGSACMKHCNTIMLELDKAQAEHNALVRSLEMKPSGAAAPAAGHEHH